MRYVIAVNHPVYGSQGAFLAYQFAQALIEQHHHIVQVFFFQAGVTNGNAYINPANDEFDLQKAWLNFSRQYNIPLHLCISAAQRRGVVDNQTARLLQHNNLAEGFVLAGLGEFTKAVLEADRLITL